MTLTVALVAIAGAVAVAGLALAVTLGVDSLVEWRARRRRR